MAHRDDNEIIANTHNMARFFTENRHISWVLLFAVLIWGAYSWMSMPKLKDPEIPVLVAVAICPWPGADAEQVEQLVTKPMEETIAQNSQLHEPDAGNEFALLCRNVGSALCGCTHQVHYGVRRVSRRHSPAHPGARKNARDARCSK